MSRFLFLLLTPVCLAVAPRPAVAQDGGALVPVTPRAQFVFLDGEMVRREGTQDTPLTENIKLVSGIKINFKNGIVEMPAVYFDAQGKRLAVPLCKKFTLHEGDYVRTDGSLVFATPASAAAARGDIPVAPGAQYEKYVLRGPGYAEPAVQLPLLAKKVELLTQKITLLSQGRADLPDTKSLDDQLTRLDAQITQPK